MIDPFADENVEISRVRRDGTRHGCDEMSVVMAAGSPVKAAGRFVSENQCPHGFSFCSACAHSVEISLWFIFKH